MRMANKLINIRVSDNLYSEMLSISEHEGYTNIQEFVRQSIRDNVKRLKTEIAIMELQRLRGSQKGKLLSKKELSELARKHFG